jgi:hypothetical protein
LTISEIVTLTRNLTNTDINSYTAANMLIDHNNALQKVVSIIQDSMDEADFDDINHGDYASLTTPQVASQRDYLIPQTEGVISVKKVSVTYDGTTWYDAKPLDSSEVTTAPASATAMQTTIDGEFSKTEPYFDVKFNAVWVYPMASAADVAAGAKIYIEWTRDANPFTSAEVTTGTKIPGFDTAFHPYLAYHAAWQYCLQKGKEQAPAYRDMCTDYEARIRRQYSKKLRTRKGLLTTTNLDYS